MTTCIVQPWPRVPDMTSSILTRFSRPENPRDRCLELTSALCVLVIGNPGGMVAVDMARNVRRAMNAVICEIIKKRILQSSDSFYVSQKCKTAMANPRGHHFVSN